MTHEAEYKGNVDLTLTEKEFLQTAREDLESQLQRLKLPVSWNRPHNMRRSSPMMNQIREQRKTQIAEIERTLDILFNMLIEEDENAKVSFERDKDGFIVGFSAVTKKEPADS